MLQNPHSLLAPNAALAVAWNMKIILYAVGLRFTYITDINRQLLPFSLTLKGKSTALAYNKGHALAKRLASD